MILSSLNPNELQRVIVNEDVGVLKSVKGIGLKSAQRIIIDLKDKMNIDPILSSNTSEKVNKGVPPHKTSLYVACGKNVIKIKLKQGAFSHATVLF